MGSLSIDSTLPFTLDDAAAFQNDSHVHGNWVSARSGARFPVFDPATGEQWTSCPDNGREDVEAAVLSSYKAFSQYSKTNPRRKAQLLMNWYNECKQARRDLAHILTYETGKPLQEAYDEIDYALGFLWWFSGEADRIQGSVFTPSAPNRRTVVIKQPIGVVTALVPWNFPIAMVLRKAGAALAAGCTIIIKPSPETPLSCLSLAHLAARARFPEGVINVLTTSQENTPPVSEALCLHPLVKKVTFTGSTAIEKLVAGLCARGLKKCTLELGGNCPFIVFDDANLDDALDQYMKLKWRHAGQACVTANRLYLQSGIHDQFVQALTERVRALVVGHGSHKGTTMGPVTTSRSVNKAKVQIDDALHHGAQRILGGEHRSFPEKSCFVPPTILTNMNSGMLISKEESFAPICGVFKFETEDEVVHLANDTNMGLASYAFTKNVDRLWRMLENLEAGMIGLVRLSH